MVFLRAGRACLHLYFTPPSLLSPHRPPSRTVGVSSCSVTLSCGVVGGRQPCASVSSGWVCSGGQGDMVCALACRLDYEVLSMVGGGVDVCTCFGCGLVYLRMRWLLVLILY